ncbi:MAG: hypothetical protein GOMPHAMPRED_001441 [Gomphillus americanus]|uniref:Transposase n=1 Tax=Gomphillus americanus TaxID=1940652 RepID=A0A8H3I7V9_9LECA|nr:MAG: hypothetical protein GOMPHAMPRED_001441 [Gomphillus americanus]
MAPAKPNASRGLTRSRRLTLLRYLELGWRETEIALVNQSTISRMLKRRKLSKTKKYRITHARSAELRRLWRIDAGRFNAEDFVFLDESIFNEKTGWRYSAYGPIGSENRYHCNSARRDVECASRIYD